MKAHVRAILAAAAVACLASSPAWAASYEAESLAVTNSGTGTSLQTDSNASGGQWISLNATGTGSWMEFTATGVPAGSYTVKMKYKTNNNRGQCTLRVDGTQVGGTLDQYAALPSQYPETTWGTVTLAAGDHKLRLTVTGKNSASSSYVLSADNFTLVDAGTPPPPTPTPTPSSGGANGGTWEAESLSPTASGASTAMQNDASATGGTWLALLADGSGDFVQFTTPSLNGGTYSLVLAYKAHTSRGILQASVDGSNVGSTLDQYTASPGFTSRNLGAVTLGAGVHTIRLTCTGKNSASAAFTLSADTLSLSPGGTVTPTPTPTATPTGSTPTPTPSPTPTPQSGWTLKWTADPARDMGSWEGVEDDRANSHPEFGHHIRAEGDLFHWYMHMVDRDGSDRQRHEVKGMNQSGTNLQMLQGETWKFVYEMFMPTSLTGGAKFTHIHQMKMVSDAGSSGTPLSTLSTSLSGSTETLVMRSLNGGTNFNPIPLAPLRGHWIEIELEYKIGFGGYARMCVRDGGNTVTDKTMTGVDMWINEGTCCRYARPKWGIYRSLLSDGLKDTYLEIRNLRAYKK
jgi:chitin-binding protein